MSDDISKLLADYRCGILERRNKAEDEIIKKLKEWDKLREAVGKVLKNDEYEKALQKYIDEEINWSATKNTVIQADLGDVEQFASDTFFHGCCFIMEMFGIKWSKKPVAGRRDG